MSPPRKKPPLRLVTTPPQRPHRRRASGESVLDLQTLVDQVQALRRLHKAKPSAATALGLSRLRALLLEALDLDEEDTATAPDDVDDFGDDDDFDEPFEDEPDEVWEEDESGEWRGRRDWTRYKSTKRIPVDDGLALRSRRGAVGASWWSKRFLSSIEPILTAGRLSRGRTYARQGQVLDLGIGSGLVVARVQGSRRTPYGVQISMPAVSDVRWDAIIEALAGQAGYAARLLAGELPHEIEDVFSAAGVSLFPDRTSKLVTNCTCPDWGNPCKHSAAVCYHMAEAFDEDPFQLLSFRGRDQETLLAELRNRRGGAVGPGDGDEPGGPESVAMAPPLSDSLANFWLSGPELADVHCLPKASEVIGTVLLQLPRGVLSLRGTDVGDLLDGAYGQLAVDAEGRAFGASSADARSGATAAKK
jgi:uncharacterized Zn finger protein